MSTRDANPFQELYVTDSPDPRVFVELFSDVLVGNASALFVPGNVVVKGTQGSGKSMLLNLLRPEIRQAYHSAGRRFPLDSMAAPFIGAGINLTRSGALDIGQRPVGSQGDDDLALFPLYFADFVNYFVVRDVLRSVQILAEAPEVFGDIASKVALDQYASSLSRDDSWFGYLLGCTDYQSVCQRIDERISWYRRFHQYNADLPANVSDTKTSIGEPIAKAADIARQTGAIKAGIEVFVRIDQIERLYRSDAVRPELGPQYRRIINKAIGARDSRVSYKLGTRRYAWEDDLTVFGSHDQLENLRDFRIVDLDELLRRGENTKTWIFPKFAEDAFSRRLEHAGHGIPARDKVVRQVLGRSPTPEEAGLSFKQASPEVALRLNDLPGEWHEYLVGLFASSPLDASLAAAWLRQRAARKDGSVPGIPVADSPLPWRRGIWRKERSRQALVQLASRTAQRLKWSGAEHILSLSGGNISVFLSICHEIWDAHLRSERRRPPEKRHDPMASPIDRDIQSAAIYTASRYWYDKVAEQPKGDDRQRLVMVLGIQFRKWLVDDLAMSYPGWNGFSLDQTELDSASELRGFLLDAADYGDLVAVPHTTKERNRRPRLKWYISPVLSAHFQIPENHAKEPFYAEISDAFEWISNASVSLPGTPGNVATRSRRNKATKEHYPLFENMGAGDAE